MAAQSKPKMLGAFTQVAASKIDTFKIPSKSFGHWLISCVAISVHCAGFSI